jgi:hypothetical protein
MEMSREQDLWSDQTGGDTTLRGALRSTQFINREHHSAWGRTTGSVRSEIDAVASAWASFAQAGKPLEIEGFPSPRFVCRWLVMRLGKRR